MSATDEATTDLAPSQSGSLGDTATNAVGPSRTIDQPTGEPVDSQRTVDDVSGQGDTDFVVENGFPKVPGYAILSELGHGAMGVVYKARHVRLKRLVALKMVLAGAHASRSQLDRFNQEAQAVARLQHPNIVQIYEIGEHDGLPFFSLEFVDGGTLAKHIDRKPQSPRPSAALLETLARAMQFAHDHNIIHRDLKPANILLAGDTTGGPAIGKTVVTSAQSVSLLAPSVVPKITDFGLAKGVEDEATQATQAGTILGTPGYMAPEQARGDVALMGPACDQYSLGAILYELLTGRPPFQAATVLDTLDQVRTREPVAPTQLQPKVPIDLETICLKCLQKDRAKRYESCKALADDLGRFLRGEPILARPVSAAERAWRWCRRNPWVAGLSATAALLVVGIAVGAVTAALRLSAKNKVIQSEKENAVAAQILAQKNADEAAQQAGITLTSMQVFIETVRVQLGEVPGTQQLKQELLTLALRELDKVSKSAETSTNTTIGATRLAAITMMGDLSKQLGKSDDALKRYREAYPIAKDRVELNQGSDASRLNLMLVLGKLADMDREVNRDMQSALAHEKEALAILHDIDQNPKTNAEGKGKIAKPVVTGQIAEMNKRVGVTYLRMGDIAQASSHFQTFLSMMRDRRAAIEKDTAATPKQKRDFAVDVAVALLAVGDTYFRLGDHSNAQAAFNESLTIYKGIQNEDANSPKYQRGLANASLLIGDFSLRTGDNAKAAEHYQRAETALAELARQDRKKFDYQWDLGFAHYRLGQHALRTKDETGAKAHFRNCLKIREELASKDNINERRQMELMLVVAHCGDHVGAAEIATRLEKSVKHDAEFMIDLGRTYAQCAAASSTPDFKTRYTSEALRALRAAVKLGYRDEVYLKTEVDLDPLRADPDFARLLEEVHRPAN